MMPFPVKTVIILVVAVVIVASGLFVAFTPIGSELWESTIFTEDTRDDITKATTGVDETTSATLSGEWGQELILIYVDGTEESLKSEFDTPITGTMSMFVNEKEVDKIKLMLGAKMTGTGYNTVRFESDTYCYEYIITRGVIEENRWKSSDYEEPDYFDSILPVDGEWHDVLVDTTSADEIVLESLAVGKYTFSLTHSGDIRSMINGRWYGTQLPANISFEFEIKAETAEEITENEPIEDNGVTEDLPLVNVPFDIKLYPTGSSFVDDEIDNEIPAYADHWNILSDNDRSTYVQADPFLHGSRFSWKRALFTLEDLKIKPTKIKSIELHGLFTGSYEKTDGERGDGAGRFWIQTDDGTEEASIFTLDETITEKTQLWRFNPSKSHIGTVLWQEGEINRLLAGIVIKTHSASIEGSGNYIEYQGQCYEFWIQVTGNTMGVATTTMSVDYGEGYTIT